MGHIMRTSVCAFFCMIHVLNWFEVLSVFLGFG